LTLLAFGGAVLMLGLSVPLPTAHALELAVGVMLVLLGIEVLYRLWRDRIHFHRHSHAPAIVHFHAHSHRGEHTAHDPDRHRHHHLRSLPARALVVGMVHGLAGSAALILLSLEAADSVRWGVAYLAMFGVGSIAGMALVSAAIAVPLRLTSRRLTWAQGGLSTIVGIVNVGLGCYIVYQSAIAGVVVGG
jgi:ABC-type nickel/cobalt efflux system permease component RcnA